MNLKWIKLGDYAEALIHVVTLGLGEKIALFVAKRFFDSDSCGCCERKEWLNKLTNKTYDGQCNGVKIF